jgi:tetratricopeptide (TPR) repeat protein
MPDPNVGYHVPQEDIKPKETILRISLNSIRLLVPNTGMYFLYVEREGEESEVSNPCICDKDITIAVAANLAPIYNKAIKLINSSLNNCNDNKQALLDIYLRKQTFLAAIELEEYQTAINIFKELLKQEIQSGLCLDINHVNNETIVLSGCKTCS